MRKKISTILKNGIGRTMDAFEEGKYNYDNPNEEMEALALSRSKECDCLVEEPIPFLRVPDERIPKLSNMMCDECGCTAAYKFRQSVEPCKNWSK